MSHTGGGPSAAPNLTPLLDVVLQLLLFFMMCVNFVSDQVPASITLPPAQAARPMTDDATLVLFLNVDQGGAIVLPGGALPLNTAGAIRAFLNQQYADDERVEAGRGGKRSIIIRADRATDYEWIYRLLAVCTEVGYKKLQLRAIHQNAS